MRRLRKLIILILSLMFFLGILLSCIYYKRGIIVSPERDKYITVYRPFYHWNNEYYVIPYKYTDILPPLSNYAIIEGGNDWITGNINDFKINWYPNDKYVLKVSFESGFLINNLDTTKFFFSKYGRNKDYLDKGDKYYYPKYGSYFLNDI